MKISIRLSLVWIHSLLFRKCDLDFFPGDVATLRHNIVLRDTGKRFPKFTRVRLLAQFDPGVFTCFAFRDEDRNCFRLTRWSLRKVKATGRTAKFARV